MIDIPMGKQYNIKSWKFITNINSLKEHFYFLLFMPLRALNICSQSGQTSLMHTALTANCGLASYFPLKWYQAHSTLLYASTVRVTSVIRLCDHQSVLLQPSIEYLLNKSTVLASHCGGTAEHTQHTCLICHHLNGQSKDWEDRTQVEKDLNIDNNFCNSDKCCVNLCRYTCWVIFVVVVFLFSFFDDGKRNILENPRSPWIFILWLRLNIPISKNEDI